MYHLVSHRASRFCEAPILRRPGIVHAFGTRHGGLSPPGDGPAAAVIPGMTALAALFETDLARVARGRQVHGNHIMVIDAGEDVTASVIGETACDGFITNRRGLALAIATADCVPLLMADPERGVVGAIHAGWKGIAGGIAKKAAKLFTERFWCAAGRVIAVIGPAIGPCCYEVGSDVYRRLEGLPWRDTVCLPAENPGTYRMDLRGAIRWQLTEAGFSRENIVTLPLCTKCRQDLFFSWRGEGLRAGRQASGILLL